MRILFLVQGEGRGHLTQALSLAQMLETAGHDVVGALVGVADNRPVPQFFSAAFPAPITAVPSPALVYSASTHELQVVRTTLRSLRYATTYRRSLRQVNDAIRTLTPDVVVNFYEILGGLTYARYRPAVPMVCVAHQYLAFHPDFPFPKRHPIDKLIFKLNSRLTALGATELLALSFDKQPDVPARRLRVVPPLLRRELADLKPVVQPYLLAYTTQPGLMAQLLEAHLDRRDVAIHAFHPGVAEADKRVDETLTYHQIDGQRFLTFMRDCTAVVTTAGFESVCEAMYLDKPVLMIPQPNHYEQACNALDGQRAGAGIASDTFDLNRLLTYLPRHDAGVGTRFRAWHAQGYFLFLSALHRAAGGSKTSTPTGFLWPRLSRLFR